jgi:phage-related protein
MKILLCILSVLTSSLLAQNIVPNPSFETKTNCPVFTNNWNYCSDWNNVNMVLNDYNYGTPDYYHYCGTSLVELPNTYLAHVLPSTGDALMGLVIYNHDIAEYREYISCKLTEKMNPEQSYTVKLKVTGGTNINYRFTSNKLGIHFSTAPLSQSGYYRIDRTAQLEISTVLNTAQWVEYSFSFVPDSSYEFITIGNFETDNNTTENIVVTSPNKYSNVFLDDISIIAGTTGNSEQRISEDLIFNFSPTRNQIDFQSPVTKIEKIIIHSIEGRVLCTYNLFENSGSISLPEFLTKGIFYATFVGANKDQTARKFLVSN